MGGLRTASFVLLRQIPITLETSAGKGENSNTIMLGDRSQGVSEPSGFRAAGEA